MSVLRYWTGQSWEIVPTIQGGGGGGGTVGPPGPPGVDGLSVEVFGPQTVTPAPFRKGDVWLQGTTARNQEFVSVIPLAQPTPASISVGSLSAPNPLKVVPLAEGRGA